MAVTVTVTPGIVLPDDPSQPVTTAELNQLGNPTVEVTGVISTSELGPGAVNYTHTKPGPYFFASCGGTASALTLTLVPALESLTQGAEVWFKSTVDCAAGATLNVTGSDGVTGLGAKALVSPVGSAVKAGDIMTNQIVGCRYSSSGSGRWEVFTTLAYPDTIYFDATNVGGTANAITVTPNPAFTADAQLVGRTIEFIAESSNTGAVQITLASGRTASIVNSNGQALTTGDILAGDLLRLRYNGTAWQMLKSRSKYDPIYVGVATYSGGTYTATSIVGFPTAVYDGLTVVWLPSTTNDASTTYLSINGITGQIINASNASPVVGELYGSVPITAVNRSGLWYIQGARAAKHVIVAAAVSASATVHSATHSCSQTPSNAFAYLECVSADTGPQYSVGDRVSIFNALSTASPNKPALSLRWNASTLYVVQNVGGASIGIPDSTTTADAVEAIDPAKWKLHAFVIP